MTPSTDPDRRSSRIRLPPWVRTPRRTRGVRMTNVRRGEPALEVTSQAAPQFLFQGPQLGLPPRPHRLAQPREVSLSGFSATMRATQKVKRLRFAVASVSSVLFRIAAQLDDSRLVGMQLRSELREVSASRSTCCLRSRACISRLNTDRHVPLPTLRRRPGGRLRITRGRCGSLLLQRMTLSFTTACRF